MLKRTLINQVIHICTRYMYLCLSYKLGGNSIQCYPFKFVYLHTGVEVIFVYMNM